jgi:hypothetical protein
MRRGKEGNVEVLSVVEVGSGTQVVKRCDVE